MFARTVEFIPNVERKKERKKKEELIKVVGNEVVPILKKQPCFLESPAIPAAVRSGGDRGC